MRGKLANSMKPFTADQIRGNWATILLPINSDDSIDFSRLEDEVDYLMEAGVDGVYTNGTAGEFYAQTEDDFDQIQTLVAERCERHNVPFQIGASHTDPNIELERVRRAAELNPAAIQIILPDWSPLTGAERLDFLQRVAGVANPIGLVLYNPPHAKRVLTSTEFSLLSQSVPSLVGIKVGGGDQSWYAQMRRHCSHLSIFVPGHHLATGFSQGAHGSYSNVACLSPKGSQRWYELMLTNLPAALALEVRIRDFFDENVTSFIVEEGFSNQAADKLLATTGDWADIGTRLRWPYRSIPSRAADQLRPHVRSNLPELFEPFDDGIF
jgi:4-hydroxy-tetrahydrodipicolinate synthase